MQNVLNFNRWMAAYAADRYARDFRKNGGTGRFIYANSEPHLLYAEQSGNEGKQQEMRGIKYVKGVLRDSGMTVR